MRTLESREMRDFYGRDEQIKTLITDNKRGRQRRGRQRVN